jgi:hypothetical protein
MAPMRTAGSAMAEFSPAFPQEINFDIMNPIQSEVMS